MGDRSIKVPFSDICSCGKLCCIHSCMWIQWILIVSQIVSCSCDEWCSFSLCGHCSLYLCPYI